ncbi:MAG: hypothetical protein HC767_14730 [Akkermansiaceae bacterium]|nr:hypothetical protein [Akkermansiaceae bacterium]
MKSEVLTFLKRDSASYDLIFADPPYWKYHGDKDHVADLLKVNCSRPAWLLLGGSSSKFPPISNPRKMRIFLSSPAANTGAVRF